MRILLLSDTQTDPHNFEQCGVAVDEVLRSADKYKPDAIVHLGDLKERYNPLDIRVAQFWARATRRIRRAGYRLILLLGNHDRISQSAESKNWLDLFKSGGIEIVTEPSTAIIGNSIAAFMPYTSDKALEKEWAADLAESGASVLFFHTEIAGASQGNGKGRGIDLQDLKADRYIACFGGHIHRHQKIGSNIWYVGSPFPHDWSEANEAKGHVLADVSKEAIKVKQIRTSLPHWYTAEFLEKGNLSPEAGAFIRSKVEVSSKKVLDQIRDEEARLKRIFGNVRLHVIPEIVQGEKPEIELSSASDRELVEQYVAATMPEKARFRAGVAVGYLTKALGSTTAPRASNERLEVLYVEAENVLCWEKVRIDLDNLGLVLIEGCNKDWGGRSNGSGKTSLLSLIPIALFGSTLKGQKHDQWMREGQKHACVVIAMRDGRGRLIEVERHRPHKLILRIDGEDCSSGIRGTGKDETQGFIESAIGFDLRMLLNSIYIDLSDPSNGFVFGTQKDRMDLVSKLQNLERFEAALKVTGQHIKKLDEDETGVSTRLEEMQQESERIEREIEDLAAKETNWTESVQKYQREVQRLVGIHSSLESSRQNYDDLQSELDNMLHDRKANELKIGTQNGELRYWQKQIDIGKQLAEAGKCDRCQQPSKKAGLGLVEIAERVMVTVRESLEQLIKASESMAKKADKIARQLDHYRTSVNDCERDLEHARQMLRQADMGAVEEAERNEKLDERRSALERELRQANRRVRAAQECLGDYAIDRELYEYAKKAFSRSGIPLYLCAALCPILNKAAEFYSEIFTASRIQLHFHAEESEFNVDVVNPKGSTTVVGQSVGESAMAGNICAFALRESAPRTNLLILDEPGHGLDITGARQFAEGLLQLKDRFGNILCTTHSDVIQSSLSGETVWTVEKESGVSRLEINGDRV